MNNKILIELIKRIGLSQKNISKQTGIAEPRFSEWVNGVRTIKFSTLEKIANTFGFDISINFEITKKTDNEK